MRTTRTLFLAGLTLSVFLQGCRGCDTPVDARYGELQFLFPVDGLPYVDSDGTYDFGTVAMGTQKTLPLVLRNVGTARLMVTAFAKRDAAEAPTAGGGLADENAVFLLRLGEPLVLFPGSQEDLEVTFAPPVDPTEAARPYRVTLVVQTEGARAGAEHTVTLLGNAVSGECDVPERIDFGAVAIGDTFARTLDLVNPREVEARAYLGPVQSQQGEVFTTSAESPRGEFVLGAMSTRTATFTFKPTQMSEYQATVRVRRAANCPERVVRLTGLGVDAVITWAPSELNFGYVPPQSTVEREVVFSNFSISPVTLSTLRAADPSLFRVVAPAGGSLELPEATRDVDGMLRPGVATVTVSFKPTTLGPRNGTLTATTTLRSQPALSVRLRGVGGGPDIDVRPSPVLSLGRIAYFADASPASYAESSLRIQNVGTASPNDPDGNLKLGELAADGTRTYWQVVPRNGAAREEICVGTYEPSTGACDESPRGYVDGVGLVAGASVQVPVRITPNGLGQREFELRIFSNDSDEPVTTLTITANSLELPECDVELTPIAIPFGIVTPPALRDAAFTIRNRRTGAGETCLVSNLRLDAEVGTPLNMPPVFSLPSGPITELELQPAESRQIFVRAFPQGLLPPTPAQVTNKVLFNVAHRAAAAREVLVSATLANSCLTISPNDLDFGTVQRDCASRTQSFNVYNTCTTPVTINTATMATPAGEGPGGPNCPGSAPCPEFHVVAGIAGSTVVMPGASAPVTFQLRYRPINLGRDAGAFVINVTQGGLQLDYVVTLRGTGDTQGLNTDTFTQSDDPKADILLAIDKSGSMLEEQERLATNLDALLDYSRQNDVDFHIAAINTELTDPNRGVFNVSAGGHRFLTDATPNLNLEYASIVQVPLAGGTESCMEPATLALTAPLINDPTKNGGFLRNDAVLAVVCVTDAPDQAPQAPVFYLNQLLAIKGSQRPGAFTYNVIGPFLPNAPSSCGYDGTNDSRHEFMVTQTNGIKEEICLTDWRDSLQRISKGAFGYRLNFFLTSTPDLMSPLGIRVQLNDVDLPEFDPAFGSRIWEYDPVSNAVIFQPLYVPSRGDTLKITYQVACLP